MQTFISSTAALFVAWLMLAAGWHKLRAPFYYAEILAKYGFAWLPARTGAAVSLGLSECLVGIGLAIPASRAMAACVAVSLLLAYSLVMALALLRGRGGMDCGCGGPGGKPSGELRGGLLLRNAALAGVAWLAALPAVPAEGISGRAIERIGEWPLAAGAAFVAFVLYHGAGQIVANRRHITEPEVPR